jgi:flagellar protein FliO/FliZ
MDLDQYIRFVVALLFVIALIVAVAWLMRRIGLGGVATGAVRHRRLSVVEVMALDAKRRLVLIRKDDREHLILLSNAGDQVVESTPAQDFHATLHAHHAADHHAGEHGATPHPDGDHTGEHKGTPAP